MKPETVLMHKGLCNLYLLTGSIIVLEHTDFKRNSIKPNTDI